MGKSIYGMSVNFMLITAMSVKENSFKLPLTKKVQYFGWQIYTHTTVFSFLLLTLLGLGSLFLYELLYKIKNLTYFLQNLPLTKTRPLSKASKLLCI